MRIGFAGIGRMGEPMAMRLLQANFPLVVWNRSPERLAAITAAGARAATTPRELAAESDEDRGGSRGKKKRPALHDAEDSCSGVNSPQ